MEDPAIPEDDASPDAPIEAVLQRQLQTVDPDLTTVTDRLGRGQVLSSLGEEQLVLSRPDTFSVL
jgi:hypothetical protein